MKKPILISLLAVALAGGAWGLESGDVAPETVRLRAKVDRPILFRGAGEQEVIIKIDLDGAAHRKLKRAPLNLSVVIDRSGSMTGRKLEQAKQAAEMLVDQLRPEDVFSLVMYDTEVDVLAPAQPVGKDRSEFKRIIRNIRAGGSTALYAGVETGGRQLQEFLRKNRINRVLLLSDGIANVGPSSNREIARLGHRLAERGVSVSTVGLGDDYNEDLMTALAEASDANYYYVADVEELSQVFEKELGELQSIVARRLVLEIVFPEGVKPKRFLGRPETISGQRGRIEFDTLAGAQTREVLVSCVLDPARIGRARQLAGIGLAYEDSVCGDGILKNLDCDVVVEVTDDAEVAEKNRDADVTVQAEIYRNASEAEEAIALADSGNAGAARVKIESQIGRLRMAQEAAPAAGQKQALEREISVLEESRDELGSDGFSKSSRKNLQWNVFQYKNSKNLR